MLLLHWICGADTYYISTTSIKLNPAPAYIKDLKIGHISELLPERVPPPRSKNE